MGRTSDARERLLGTAARLVHRHGYNAVSVADICECAGLRKGSFYHFFPSKQALVAEAMKQHASDLRSLIGGTTCTSLRDRLLGLVESIYAKYVESRGTEGCLIGCPIGNLALEMAPDDPDMRARVHAVFRGWQQSLAESLAAGMAAGELREGDVELMAESVVAGVQGATVLAKAADDPEVFRRLARHAVLNLVPWNDDCRARAHEPSADVNEVS
jgi:TetR/AcrR family transcriptional regulator, transcriptional repressor for nem operon